ncbi:hypothetical protein PSMK_00570 [Phycisphaera mikurensis NBRC 102666]|uniref:Uncharacterized protein n=1 Tax=Phycisphaera mikurensis (strain NBRC 102666 / KCTC 22515 / FYK2301M01) TaxID=1142394 RepID=I0IAC8_PHYMF|nr:hypothetical protein PSMK_00570 [Phycisphaera mikurensis NBRC 102666]
MVRQVCEPLEAILAAALNPETISALREQRSTPRPIPPLPPQPRRDRTLHRRPHPLRLPRAVPRHERVQVRRRAAHRDEEQPLAGRRLLQPTDARPLQRGRAYHLRPLHQGPVMPSPSLVRRPGHPPPTVVMPRLPVDHPGPVRVERDEKQRHSDKPTKDRSFASGRGSPLIHRPHTQAEETAAATPAAVAAWRRHAVRLPIQLPRAQGRQSGVAAPLSKPPWPR